MKKAYLLLIVLCYVIFFVAIPPFQLPDEPDHFQYVYWLSKGIYPRLPNRALLKVYDPTVQKIYDIIEVASNDYNIPNYPKIAAASRSRTPFTTKPGAPAVTYQAHHPPLYHTSALLFFLPAYALSKGSLIITYYATKLISFLFYMISVLVVFRIGLLLLKNNRIAHYLAMVYALNPVTIKMGVTINPDIASTAFTMCILYLFLHFLNKKTFSLRQLLLTSLLLSVAALTKFQNVVYICFAFVFFVANGIRFRQTGRFAKYAFAVAAMAAVPIAPWLIFSLVTYHAITPSYIAYQYFCTANLPLIPWYRIPFEVLFEFRHAFYHFAGFLGWGEPYPFKPFFLLHAAGFMSLVGVGIFTLVRKRQWQWWVVLAHALMICLFFLGVSITYKINRYSCDVQGRYLLTALYPFILTAWIGLTALFAGKKEGIARAMMFFAIWQYFLVLCYVLIPRYYV